jgi:hypothetical protein
VSSSLPGPDAPEHGSRISGGKRTPGSFCSRHATRSIRCRASCFAQPNGRPSSWRDSARARPRRRICWLGGSPWTWAAATTPIATSARPHEAGAAVRRCRPPVAGSAKRCGPRRPAIRAACSRPAAAGWRCWTSTGSPWARRNCEPRPPRRAPSWPRSPSAMPRGRTGRVSCSPGVNAGGPPRSRSRPCGPPADAGLAASLTALRRVTADLDQARREGVPPAALKREQRRLENAVRASSLRTRGSAEPAPAAVSVAGLAW